MDDWSPVHLKVDSRDPSPCGPWLSSWKSSAKKHNSGRTPDYFGHEFHTLSVIKHLIFLNYLLSWGILRQTVI